MLRFSCNVYKTGVVTKGQQSSDNFHRPMLHRHKKHCISKESSSWFQTFAVSWMLSAFFWVIPQSLKFICRRFGTLCLFLLHRQVGACRINILHAPTCLWRWNRVFRNVGIYNSDAGESHKRNQTRIQLYRIIFSIHTTFHYYNNLQF